MSAKKVREDARDKGIDEDLVNFLLEHFSRPGHHHSIGQVDGLTEALEGDGDDDEDDEEDELHPAPHFGEYEDEG